MPVARPDSPLKLPYDAATENFPGRMSQCSPEAASASAVPARASCRLVLIFEPPLHDETPGLHGRMIRLRPEPCGVARDCRDDRGVIVGRFFPGFPSLEPGHGRRAPVRLPKLLVELRRIARAARAYLSSSLFLNLSLSLGAFLKRRRPPLPRCFVAVS